MGRGGEGVILPNCWFALNNSETVKAVTLVFCSIQKLFIRNNRTKSVIFNSPQSPDIGKNSDEGVSDFQISDQSFINKNCHNSRTSHDIDIKLGSVAKLDKRNTVTSKKLMMTSCLRILTSFSLFRLMSICNHPETGFLTHDL